MAQHSFQHFGGNHGPENIEPTELNMYHGTFGSGLQQGGNGFSGSAVLGDDDLLDGLNSPADQSNMQGQDFSGMPDMSSMAFSNHSMYDSHPAGASMAVDGPPSMHAFSNTPDGEPIQSPFAHNYGHFRQMPHPQSFNNQIQSPVSFPASPLAASDVMGGDSARPRLGHPMQNKPSNSRAPVTPNTTVGMGHVPGPSHEPNHFTPAQPIRTANGAHHDKSNSGQWTQTPNSLSSYPGSAFPSSLQAGGAMHTPQISEMLLKGGASMPAKLGHPAGGPVTAQDIKKKRRRESHNLVERRRRDNINERIQDLSKLVPTHRLEDDKLRKLIQNGTPLSPTLQGIPSPSQATSSLAGPGARRASGAPGNITTGLPVEEKDKGPNKGDILNGAVSWTRDLMWAYNLKQQQVEELLNYIVELGAPLPFELTEDDKRMQSEVAEATAKNDPGSFSYSRTAGSGLRVPNHTDYKGDSLSGANSSSEPINTPPDDGRNGGVGVGEAIDRATYWQDMDDEVSADMRFKEEDEYGMDLN